ncbi:DUF1232 domain-containing protein [Exilibacterium tricleocarpae]|uniref:DUF1232 domain-containing protein n=1 Tax=Exilibacterium tricleocarpae TaxID=2591008 RepID=A0A545TZH8_9GAMM|nr:DUF1232 domain-containing protein [Exilibacterium tricleocarpae]TQV82616.1 DUF1232 domain-containing protein [Exilibacterium tricleocarpae]
MDNSDYTETSFWEKVKTYAKAAGRETIETALKLYYTLQDKETPGWAKTTIIGALVYFIAPVDTVPDLLPGGYVDDLGALAAAAWTVASHIKDEHVEKAKQTLRQWFDEDGEPAE